ncbi:MAG: hypothetical protein O3A81_02530 [bacterium]|nr:hypothetical protein [bacterium]
MISAFRQQLRKEYLLRNTAAVLIVLMVPTIAHASSWNPTLLVNTEAFTTIDDGDGSSNIEMRFGGTGSGLILNVTDNQFEFDASLEVQGTVSGNIIHAQDTLTSSGGLVVEGESQFNEDATFGSGIVLNGVKYIFPFGDASATGKLLASDGAGNLSWTSAGATPNVFQTISVFGQSDVVTDTTADTLTFAAGSNITITTNSGSDTITIAATDTNTTYTAGEGIDLTGTVFSRNAALSGTSLEVIGTASGRIVHAQDTLTSSGTLVWEGAASGATLYLGGKLEGAGLSDCDTAGTSKLLWDATTGRFSCGTDTDTDTQLSQEQVEDFVDGVITAGTGITLTYDDAGGTLTIQQGFSSGSQVSLSPEYAGAVYYGDGADNVGQMVLAYDSTYKENFYKWTSTAGTLQDYNIAVRVKVPDSFDHWDGTAPIQFRYRTNAVQTADNQIDVTMLDTAGSGVSLTGGTDLANTSWMTETITGPEAAGTYTPGSYITILIAMQARTTNTGEAHAGFLNINWHTEP